jgi:hypothetical protein
MRPLKGVCAGKRVPKKGPKTAKIGSPIKVGDEIGDLPSSHANSLLFIW